MNRKSAISLLAVFVAICGMTVDAQAQRTKKNVFTIDAGYAMRFPGTIASNSFFVSDPLHESQAGGYPDSDFDVQDGGFGNGYIVRAAFERELSRNWFWRVGVRILYHRNGVQVVNDEWIVRSGEVSTYGISMRDLVPQRSEMWFGSLSGGLGWSVPFHKRSNWRFRSVVNAHLGTGRLVRTLTGWNYDSESGSVYPDEGITAAIHEEKGGVSLGLEATIGLQYEFESSFIRFSTNAMYQYLNANKKDLTFVTIDYEFGAQENIENSPMHSLSFHLGYGFRF